MMSETCFARVLKAMRQNSQQRETMTPSYDEIRSVALGTYHQTKGAEIRVDPDSGVPIEGQDDEIRLWNALVDAVEDGAAQVIAWGTPTETYTGSHGSWSTPYKRYRQLVIRFLGGPFGEHSFHLDVRPTKLDLPPAP